MQNTSLSEWLGTLTGFSATAVNRLWRILVLLFPAYCVLLGVGNILSGTGYNHVNWFLLFVWEFLAIGILVSPYVWGGIVGLAAGREVTAGEAGFQFGHVYAAFGELGKKFSSFWFQYIMLWPAIGFLYLAAFDTTGAITLHFVLLVLLVLAIPCSVYLWPGSKGMVNFFSRLIVLGALVFVGFLIWQALNRQLMDPAERTVLEASEALEKKRQDRMDEVARGIKKKLFKGQALTPEEQTAWATIQQSMSEQSIIGRLKGVASIHKNEADKAMAADETRARNARIKKATDCFDKLTPESTEEARGTCKHLHWMIDQGQSFGGSAQAKIPPLMPKLEGHEEPTTTSAPPQAPNPPPAQRAAETAPKVATTVVADPSTWTCTPYQEFDYSPQQQMNSGFKTEPGKYLLTFEGEREHVFHRKVKDGGKETARDEKYATCRIDAAGNLSGCKDLQGNPLTDFTVKHEELARWLNTPLTTPDRSQPYGKVIVRVDGKALMIGSKGWFETKSGDVGIDLNVDRYPLNYMGHGLKGTLHKCEAT